MYLDWGLLIVLRILIAQKAQRRWNGGMKMKGKREEVEEKSFKRGEALLS
jgi:hypothetical protein